MHRQHEVSVVQRKLEKKIMGREATSLVCQGNNQEEKGHGISLICGFLNNLVSGQFVAI